MAPRTARGLRVLRRTMLALAVLSVVWLAAIWIAPVTLPAGTVAGLSGHANIIEYNDRWADMPAAHAAVYWTGDLICHQRADRSGVLGGNQMPVDTRLTGIFLGLPLGLAASVALAPALRVPENARRVLIRIGFPATLTGRGALLVLGALMAPAAIDGTVQLLAPYESSNLLRVATGLLAGLAGGPVLASVLGPVFADTQAPAFTPRSRTAGSPAKRV